MADYVSTRQETDVFLRLRDKVLRTWDKGLRFDDHFCSRNPKTEMDMKKYLTFFVALAAFVSCQKENTLDQPFPTTGIPVTFELTATQDNAGTITKARKTEWTAGDVIYVFLEQLSAPFHVQMHYDGTSWTSKAMNGLSEIPSTDLGLSEKDMGFMRAVYYPFHSNPVAIETSYGADFSVRFQNGYPDSYYLTAQLIYEVRDGKVSGAFDMRIPDEFVQFWIEDAAADTARQVRLYNEVILPERVEGVYFNSGYGSGIVGGPTNPGAPYLTGYPYEGGWLFSGIINDAYLDNLLEPCYVFGKAEMTLDSEGNAIDMEMETLFVEHRNIHSLDAIILPPWGSARWQPFGPGKTVEFHGDHWQTVNYGVDLMRNYFLGGSDFDFNTANSLGLYLPSKDQWRNLLPLGSLDHHVYQIKFYGDYCLVVIFDLIEGKHLIFPDAVYWTSTDLVGSDEAISVHVWYWAFNPQLRERRFQIRALAGPTDPVLNTFNPEIVY